MDGRIFLEPLLKRYLLEAWNQKEISMALLNDLTKAFDCVEKEILEASNSRIRVLVGYFIQPG